jgi:hypothetical protein
MFFTQITSLTFLSPGVRGELIFSKIYTFAFYTYRMDFPVQNRRLCIFFLIGFYFSTVTPPMFWNNVYALYKKFILVYYTTT